MGKSTIIKFSFFILTIISSFLAWNSADAAINGPGSGGWLAPILWFSLLFVILALGVMLIKEFYLAAILAFFPLLLSLLFAPAFSQLVAVILAFLLFLAAIYNIRHDLTLSIKISPWKTLRSGSTIIILAFSLAIAGQYYNSVKNSSTERIIPKFTMAGPVGALAENILAVIDPQLKSLSDQNMTVDQLILQSQKIPLTPVEQQQVLEQGRKNISGMVGVPITGNEKAADILSDYINNKISNYVAPNFSDRQNLPLLPIVMAFIVFLTVASLGSLISPLLVLLSDLMFLLLIKAGAVTIEKVMREVEIIS